MRTLSRRRSFVLRVFAGTMPSCLSREIRGCLRRNRSYTARKILSRSAREKDRNLRKMPDIEDVWQRDASHSIIISLLAFPKGLYQALPRIQSNTIGD